jgi:hypothetical protein
VVLEKTNTRLSSAILLVISLLCAAAAAAGQTPDMAPKPVSYTTAPKLVVAMLKDGGQDVYEVHGKVTFTITAANSDDTIAGTLNYAIPDDARQKISALNSKPLNTIPTTVTRKDILAIFQKGTSAPIIHLEVAPSDVDVTGVEMAFNRIVLDINGREGGSITQYSKEEMEALFTVWARQINNHRARRGVIARINKLINGEPEQ